MSDVSNGVTYEEIHLLELQGFLPDSSFSLSIRSKLDPAEKPVIIQTPVSELDRY